MAWSNDARLLRTTRDSRGVGPTLGFAESLALPQQRLGFGITGKIMQHRTGRNRSVGPGLPVRRGIRVGQGHGSLECGEGARVPFRFGRLTKPSQGCCSFQHRQLAALLLLIVGRLEYLVIVPLGQGRACPLERRETLLGGSWRDLAIDQGLDLRQGKLDQRR